MDNPQDTQIREAIAQHVTTYLQKILGINYFISTKNFNDLPEHNYPGYVPRIDIIIETKNTINYPYIIMLQINKSNLTINSKTTIDLNDPNSITKIEETLDAHIWSIQVFLDSKIWSPNLQ